MTHTRTAAAFAIVVLVALGTVGCRGGDTPSPGGRAGFAPQKSSMDGGAGPMGAPAAAPPAPDMAMRVEGIGPAESAAPQPVVDRKIIRNGNLTVEVSDLSKAMDAVRAATAAAGGYVTNESEGRDEYDVRQGSLTCRLPAAKLDATVAQFQGMGRLISVSIHANDITDQYVDLDTRLRNQRQLEARLVALFDRAGNKVADLLEVEREVARVRSEVESLEGRKRLWDSQIALSTLTVGLHEPRPALGSNSGGILRTLRQAFRSAGENIVDTVAWFIAAAGVAIPAFLVLWALWRGFKALRGRRRVR